VGHKRFVLSIVSAAAVAGCQYTPRPLEGPDDPADADVLTFPDSGPRADARVDARPDAPVPDATPGTPDATPLPPDAALATCPGYTHVPHANPPGATYRGSTSGAAWTIARQDCIDDGGNLVVVDDANEAAAIAGLVDDPESPFFWVGIFDPSGGGDNNWLTVLGGSPGYLPWGNNQPTGGNDDCILQSDYGSPYEFFDWGCGAPQFYVCECLP
jgi:hypothetical protein